ncbi:MAG: hypothetical protein ACLGIC_12685 [Acidimicrobiia bacterium]
MRNTFTRGGRRLLVTAGVMTLGLAAVAPTTVWANNGLGRGAGDAEQHVPPGLGQQSHGHGHGHGQQGQGQGGQGQPGGSGAGLPDGSGAPGGPTVDSDRWSWVCHRDDPEERWELIFVNANSWPAHEAHGDVRIEDLYYDELEAIAEEHDIDLAAPASFNQLGEDEEAVSDLIDDLCVRANGESPGPVSGGGGAGGGAGGDSSGGDSSGGGNPSNGNPGNGNDNGNGNAGEDNPGNGSGDSSGGGDDEPIVDDSGSGQTPQPVQETPADPVVAPAQPVDNQAPPAAPPLQGTPPKPVTISDDSVVRPVVATPAAPKKDDAEVLGSITTRTPGGQVLASQTLPRTGSDLTVALAAAGAALLLAGVALEAASRRTTARAGGHSAA